MEDSLNISSPSWKQRVMSKLKSFVKWFLLLSIGSVILFRFVPVPISPFMIYNIGIQAFDDKRDIRLKKDWEPNCHISKHIQLAVICAEDQRFYEHFGLDFTAIKKALKSNEKGRKIKGGSTITQQTAKNVFLLPQRNYLRKAIEAYFTVLIELFWSKERILEVYLNVIEFGNGIYGVESASQYYFDKSAKDLTKEEAALMAAVLPNPNIYLINNPSRYVKKRQRWILRQMNRNGYEILQVK